MVYKCKNTRRDLPPGLLNPLPIPNQPGQHLSIDFHSFPKNWHGYDSVYIIVDQLSKRVTTIPCHKTITSGKMAKRFIRYIYPWSGPPDTIVLDHGL
jgi:hypothetical protein